MTFPENLKYTKDHEWIRVEGSEAVVGITEFAQSELSDVVYVDIRTQGEQIERDAVFGTVEATKAVSDLLLPVSGTILEVNSALNSSPDLVNSDPYGAGWMVRIALSNPSEADELMDSAAYRNFIGK